MRRFSPREINWLRKWEVSPCGAGSNLAGQISQIPVEYMTSWAEFYGRNFIVNTNVLIPRIETEQLIDESIKILTLKIDSRAHSRSLGMTTIADLGTGCGCIGITLYLELVKLGIKPTIYISDISEEALEIAKKNISGLIKGPAFSKRPGLLWLKSDLFDSYPINLKLDLVIANLPYIPSSRIQELPEPVKDFEPHLALDGGPGGLRLINKLIAQSESRLKPNGVLLLEIDESHKIKDLSLPKNFQAEIIKDQFGKRRFVKIFPAEQERIKDIGEICQDTQSQSKNH